MPEHNLIPYLRQFFLDYSDKDQRHEYAGSLPEEIKKTLLDFEESFIHDGVASEGIQNLLRIYQLESIHQEVSQIQTAFYLNVNERSSTQSNVEDHINLIDAKNPSYSFLTDDDFESDLETILRFKDRDVTREKVKVFEQQRLTSQGRRKSPFIITRTLLRYTSIAVAASLFLIVWQPFQESDNNLFNSYIATDVQIGIRGLYKKESGESGIRAQKDVLTQGLNEIEKVKITEAYSLFESKSYQAATKAFLDIGISPDKGQGFLIYLAISQLRINDLENAKNNLQSVISLKNSSHHDSALFYLALYYLKVGNRNEAKRYLVMLKDKPGPYQDESTAILNKLRWF